MSVQTWSPSAHLNDVADPRVPAIDGASARQVPGLIREVMSASRNFADDLGGAITTTGSANAYLARSASGIASLRPGLMLLIRADRDNTAEATLNVDGLGPLPWVDAGGVRLKAGRILKDRFYPVIFDDSAAAWRIQAGASTLDEIPGLAEGLAAIDGVAANAQAAVTAAASASTNAQSAVDAKTQTAADRTLTASDRLATASARDAAIAASGAVTSLAAGNSVNFDTYLLLISGTVGVGATFPNALSAYVNFDTDDLNGFYTRSSTVAPWVRSGSDTFIAASQRSRVSALGLNGVRDAVLYRDALDVPWGMLDPNGRMPLSFSTSGRATLAALQLVGTASARDGIPFTFWVEDPNGFTALALTPEGELVTDRLRVSGAPYRDAYEHNFRIEDMTGRYAFGVSVDGTTFVNRLVLPGAGALYRDAYPYATSISGSDERVALGVEYDGKLTFRASAETLAHLSADLGVIGSGSQPAGWRETAPGETVLRITPDATGLYQFGLIREPDQTVITAIQAKSPSAPTTAMVWHYDPITGVFWYGQSNAGKGDSTDPADQTTLVYPHHVVTFSGGLATGTDDPVDLAGLTGLKPQADDIGATWQAVAFSNALEGISRERGRKTPGLFSWTVWKGSTALTNFVRGTQAWNNLMAGIDAMPAAAASLNRVVNLDVINVVQGESGPGSSVSTALSRSTYYAVCAPFYQDLRNEAGSRGPKTLPWIYVAQVNRAVQDTIPPGVALAQWDAALAQRYQGVVLIPMYMCPIAPGSGVHPGDPGRMVYGETVKVIKDITDTGVAFNPLWPKTNGTALAADWITRTGAVIKIKFDLPPGGKPIAFDTSWVPAVANMGFVYSDSAGNLIQSVAITGTNEVSITLTDNPDGASNRRIFYAQDVPEFIRDQATQQGWSKGRGNLVSPTGISSFYYAIGKAVPPTIKHYCIRFEGDVP